MNGWGGGASKFNRFKNTTEKQYDLDHIYWVKRSQQLNSISVMRRDRRNPTVFAETLEKDLWLFAMLDS